MGNEKYFKYNRLLCISLDNYNPKNFPEIIKNFIHEGLKEEEKVLVFTDHISYEDVEKNFPVIHEYINNSITNGNLRIKLYDPVKFSVENDEFIDILEVISMFKNKIRIIWDFKNFIKRPNKLQEILKVVDYIFSKLDNENVKNIVYINNYVYDLKLFKKLCYKFKILITFNKYKEAVFRSKNEITNCIWLLQNNAQLKFQNNNLVLFNDEFCSITKGSNEEEFKNTIINRLIELCDVDFCVLYTSVNLKENILALDNYYNITKKHKYYMMNDMKFIEWINDFNNNIIKNKKNELFLNSTEIKDKWLKDLYKEMDIKSYAGIYVEYYQNIKGIICLGKYAQKEISEEDIEYIESICKAAFFLIQEQKNFANLQNRLIENEKLRAMGEMAAGIAHDINNVLTPIIGSVQILKEKIIDKEILKQLEIVEMCANDGMNITNKVKKITRNYSNKEQWEIFNIDKIIIDAVDLTKNKWMHQSALNGIQVKVIPQLKANVLVKGNITEIREVFINIISNAVDSMPLGGKIEIISKKVDNNVEIEIRDNGLGMNKEIIKRVFEPFFTTKGNNGSGLGLSVSYKIVQSHFGDIKIESEENVGTSFQIKLPICKEKECTCKIQENNRQICDKKIQFNGSVLVVDDQERVRKVISDMVKSIWECKVKTCSGENIDGELRRRNYDIILCDFSMPNINGIQVAKKVNNLQNSAYFCLMTGWVGSFEKDKLEYVDFILNKPISKRKLNEMFYNYNEKNNK